MGNPENTRRVFLRELFAAPCISSSAAISNVFRWSSASPPALAPAGSICDVGGIKIGHYTDPRRPTGCTVILAEAGATAGVDVRGSAPGTRETDLLNPLNTVEKVHAILLAGGSAFGLEAASGVMQYLEERGIGYATRVAKVPIVPAAILFDLELGDSKVRPDKQAGYQACKNARPDSCVEGNFGAGAGATVGKLFGFERAMKSGIGTASMKAGSVIVGAIVAVNSAGDVIDPQKGRILAGARGSDGKTPLNSMEQIRQGKLDILKSSGENTTIGVVATNVALSKSQINKIAQMAHDGLARAINPVHTPVDGDALFALSTNTSSHPSGRLAELIRIGSLAADTVTRAVCRAVLAARGLPGFPSYYDLYGPEQRG
ncbi:MAG: peptidase S58 [Acidobacteria bacterium]|nr:MAG: peptidase S58 [Acidobacteriota bacterium]